MQRQHNFRSRSAPAARSGVSVEHLEPRRLAAAHAPLLRIGALGDSYTDEYQFYPPDRSHARNWVEQLANHKDVSVGAFTSRSRGTPRNKGYANDWALSDATSADLPIQTAGLAAQAAAGQIDVATILIGGDDFLDLLESAAISPDAAAGAATQLASAGQSVAANIETAADAILAASPGVKVVIATLPPVSQLPLVHKAEAAGLAGARGPQLVADADAAELQVNAALTAFAVADAPRIAVADFAAAAAALTASPSLHLGKATLSATVPGNGPHHLFLADGIHPGTVGQAVLANTIVSAIDRLGFDIKPLTPRQTLLDAHLA